MNDKLSCWENFIMEDNKENINDKPIIVEKFADNGAHSHWELINDDGIILWSGGKE